LFTSSLSKFVRLLDSPLGAVAVVDKRNGAAPGRTGSATSPELRSESCLEQLAIARRVGPFHSCHVGWRSGLGRLVALATLLIGGCAARSPLERPVATTSDGPSSDDTAREAGAESADGGVGGDAIDWDAQDGMRFEVGPACSIIEYSDPDLSFEGTYPDSGLSYDGHAQVTDWTGYGLTLTLTDATLPNGVPPYIYLRGTPAPELPVGADVWLTLKYDGQNVGTPCAAYGPGPCPVALGWAFSVSDRQQGTELFGQTHEDPNERLGLINPGRAVPYCSAPNECAVNIFYAVAVAGADVNPIPTGGYGNISIGRVSYHFWVEASSTQAPSGCEYAEPADKLVTITFQANDLASRAAALAPH
jgi:hypothetical protein